MKTKNALFITLIMTAIFLVGCQRNTQSPGAAETAAQGSAKKSYIPTQNVIWVCTSTAGGNSDIFTRTMAEIVKTNNFAEKTIVVENRTDGGGTVGQRTVSQLKGIDADHTLLTFTTGDMPSILENTPLKIEDFKCIATLLRDKHIIYVTKNSKFKTFNDFVNALAKGEKIVIGGSKADDIMFYNLLKKTVDKNNNLSYLQYTATNEVAVAALGGHIEIAIGKPAVCTPYIENGDFFPVAIEGDSRSAAPYQDTPTLKELGYDAISFIQYRSIVGPKAMSDEAVAYWEEVFKKVSQSDDIMNNYVKKYLSELSFMDSTDTSTYYATAQKNTLESLGSKK
jgi:putative tricarboxylic transport membrane protein